MSVKDTLISNIDKTRYVSIFPSDKILYEGSATYSVASTGIDVEETVPNPLGVRCFPTMAWSIDNTNFYPPDAAISPTNPYSANIAVSDSTLYFYFYNNSGSTQTFYIRYALDSIT